MACAKLKEMAVDSTQYSDSAQYDTAQSSTLRSMIHTAQSQFRKTRISRRNLNQNQNYFNPLLSGQRRLELFFKKTG